MVVWIGDVPNHTHTPRPQFPSVVRAGKDEQVVQTPSRGPRCPPVGPLARPPTISLRSAFVHRVTGTGGEQWANVMTFMASW
jgi:hypothetical protein